MRPIRLISGLVLAVLLLPGCAEPPPVSLLVPVYFYQGHTVGKASRSTGLQASADGGETFQTLTWPELITNSVSVDTSGRRIYLACGNGVMVSRDGGESFALYGGFELSEVQKVLIDPRDPDRAFAASAYGVFLTEDGGVIWKPLDAAGQFRFCTDVAAEPGNPDRIWVASDRGVFVSQNAVDQGATFSPLPIPVGARRILALPGRVLICTDGMGLMEVADAKSAIHRVPGPPDVVFSAAVDPRDAKTIHVGTMEGLFTSRDDGGSWTSSHEGMPEGFFVYGILPDPEIAGRLYVSGNDGVLVSQDGGATFERLGFEGALIQDLASARLSRGSGEGLSTAPGILTFEEPDADCPEFRPATNPAFDDRRAGLLAHFAERAGKAGKWPGWATAAGEIAAGRADEELWDQLRALLLDPKHSMFFSMPLMGIFLHAGDAMPDDLKERIREVMTRVAVYRGDTENHWVMHYTALLLAAQTWPETSAADWYAGRTTQELYDEARGWLIHWAQLAAGYGQGEFDSPNYMFMYVTPMFLLYDFAKEPKMRQLAGMMLDLLLADYLVESLEGAYCGGHSRIIGKEVELTRNGRTAVLHHLFAGGIEKPANITEWAGFAALSSYRPPAVFEPMANQRGPWSQQERKRVRNVIRFGEELNPPVYKNGLMTEIYHLGSLQGGILQPIQQHTFDVTWIGSAENSRLFTVHPSVSARELGMFFPEEIHKLTETITAQKGVYGSPDKIISASAFEKVKQLENVLLALYQVPEGERFGHVSLYWPDCLEKTEENGWLFGRDGEFWVAVYPTGKGVWEPEEGWLRYRCPAGEIGFAVVTREFGEWGVSGTFEGFKRKILDGPAPTLTGTGDDLTLSYDVKARLTAAGPHPHRLCWGEEREFPEDRLFEGPFMYAKTGTRVIRMRPAGSPTRTLDFNTFTITETK